MAEQFYDHLWLTIGGEAWAIAYKRGNQILLWRGYAPNLEFLPIDATGWDTAAYADAAVAMLEAQYGPLGQKEGDNDG